MSDGTASTSVLGLLGDVCVDNRDCFIDFSSCSENMCTCLPGYNPTSGNISCEGKYSDDLNNDPLNNNCISDILALYPPSPKMCGCVPMEKKNLALKTGFLWWMKHLKIKN